MFRGQWWLDFLIYLYLVSILFSFADLVQPNPRSRRLSYLFLVIVFLGVTIRGGTLLVDSKKIESTVVFVWSFLGIALLGKWFFRRDLLSFSLTALGFGFLLYHVFFAKPLSMVEHQQLFSKLILLHIALAIMAYAAFLVSGIGSAFYLLCNLLLKKKMWNQWLMRLPSLGHLQWFSYWFIAVGFFLLLISLPLGGFWAIETLPTPIWVDAKFWISLLMLGFYGYILYCSHSGCSGKRLAWLNSLALLLLLFNFFISKTSWSFHHWT